MPRSKAHSVDEYIAGFPKETQKVLWLVRETIKEILPQAEEVISYAIPAYKLNKSYVIYFAGFEHHIGLYPAPVNEASFKKEFSKYKTGKGSVQFPLDKTIPLNLIRKITRYRLKLILDKTKPTKT